MNVLFVSQCSGKALTQTRRILDQFAERRGDRSWHTAITSDGLKTVHHILRRKARKNSAVACFHFQRSRTKTLWIVGNARQFNFDGATPTNTTKRDLVRSKDENDRHHGELIRQLAVIAALFHDYGKANNAFQKKLQGGPKDAYRHEWVSLRLFAAFVGESKDDRAWLEHLADNQSFFSDWQERLMRDGVDTSIHSNPLHHLPPLAAALGWLIVSHHRLSTPENYSVIGRGHLEKVGKYITDDWCGASSGASDAQKEECWQFDRGLPLDSKSWREHAARAAHAMLRLDLLSLQTNWLDHPQVMHLARLSLILADHHYSSQESNPNLGEPAFTDHHKVSFANTDGNGDPKQRLDEHLIGVGINAKKIARDIQYLDRTLPRIAHHREFRKRTAHANFQWQNRAFDLAEGLRKKSAQHGFFGVNMASTGTGKTLANGRILYGLAEPEIGARLTFALGLRTLTLQTGTVYRNHFHLDERDLAVLVGGGAVRELYEDGRPRAPGSDSSEELLPEHTHVHFEGSLKSGPLKKWLEKQTAALLNAPVVACTIDHLMPATESTRGGRQILPMLRLMTSDLVLDEVDDFDPADLHAVTRLVNWAGMLGSRALLSSATLAPALVQGLFQAYKAGRVAYQKSHGEIGLPVNICCAWFDEFTNQAHDCADSESFHAAHQKFVEHRIKKLRVQPVRRHARIIPIERRPGKGNLDEKVYERLTETLHPAMHQLHKDNALTDPKTGKRVSIGLIRMANIDPLVETAVRLVATPPQSGFELHLSVYHSQFPLLLRHTLEQRLDHLLRRDNDNPMRLFEDAEIRQLLDASDQSNSDIMFVILASPVAEVGRDHDYDWAIVEPSSMRAIIQLAGRVRRHRSEPWDSVNLGLLSKNVNTLKNKNLAFYRPGFESGSFKLRTHKLEELLRKEELERIDATWRIRAHHSPDREHRLSDLEHAVLDDLMLGSESQKQTPVTLWWETKANLSGVLQAKHQFRARTPMQGYWLLPDEDTGSGLALYRRENHRGFDAEPTRYEHLRSTLEIELADRCNWWGTTDDYDLLENYARERKGDQDNLEPEEIRDCALRYLMFELPEYGESSGWWYNPSLGFSKLPTRQ